MRQNHQRTLPLSTLLAVMALPLILTIGISAKAGPIYELRMYQVDDQMIAYISNTFFSNEIIRVCNFAPDCGTYDLTEYVRPGLNTILMELYNGPTISPVGVVGGSQGYTWGFDFRIDDEVIDSGECGTFNRGGCDNNSTQSGRVWTHSIPFNVADTSGNTASVSEPSSLALAFFGLLFLTLAKRPRAKGNAAT